MKIDCNPVTGVRFRMAIPEYRALLRDDIGLCLGCGGELECCEPDTQEERCPDCGEFRVYGAEELLIRGRITLT